MSDYIIPQGHPIDSIEKAKELISGDLGKVYRKILTSCCTPIFWYKKNEYSVIHNGTLTVIQTPDKLLGITANHVVESYLNHPDLANIILQIGNKVIHDLPKRIIARSDNFDLATIDLDLSILDKGIKPLPWPPKKPQEGRGIMLAGYPGKERIEEYKKVDFGSFTMLGVAKSINHDQITALIDREYTVPNKDIPTLPENYDLGGISGGPVIAWFEEPKSFITTYRLAGIISQASSEFEYFVAKRADFINTDGTISKKN